MLNLTCEIQCLTFLRLLLTDRSVYRWHSCISETDRKWSERLYKRIFGKEYKDVAAEELIRGLSKLEAMTPDDPLLRDFGELERRDDDMFNDDDLVTILIDSIEDLAGASGANNIPEVLRAVEILGMEQAREWKCATLNEFRKFFGLTPYKTFEEISSDSEVATKLKVLYDDPDFVELYSGLVCEDAKKPMNPGVGISPTYTISRSILSDAVTLVRGDRFYTVDYHPANLTNWGFKEVAYDLSVNQGCVFYKLFIRAFPNHFTFNSIYAHCPLVIPKANHEIMISLGRVDDYDFERPVPIAPRINVASYDGVMSVLKNGKTFGVDPWRRGLYFLMGKPGKTGNAWHLCYGLSRTGADFMLAGDGQFFEERRNQMKQCLYQDGWHLKIKAFYESITLKLLKQWSSNVGGRTNQVDIIRDVGNSGMHFDAQI